MKNPKTQIRLSSTILLRFLMLVLSLSGAFGAAAARADYAAGNAATGVNLYLSANNPAANKFYAANKGGQPGLFFSGAGSDENFVWWLANRSATQARNFPAAFVCTSNPVVTNANDSGAGSLREAIANVCTGDTITFSNTTAGGAVNFYDGALRYITLTSGELVIDKNLTITGAGADRLAVSGNNATRVFNIGGGVNATINNLAVVYGSGNGGGVLVNAAATVTINNSVVNSNQASGTDAGGILNYAGTLTIVNSAVSGNSATNINSPSSGGGIFNYAGMLMLTNSIVSNNSAGKGGGIINSGTGSTINLINSTISGNSATNGGGIYNGTYTTTNMTNATVANNSAVTLGGGIINDDGTVRAFNTIIAGNTAPTAPDFYATLTSDGYNLIGNTGSMSITGTTTGNITNVYARLAPLGFYGGATQTHALLSSSPALNAGNNCVLITYGCGDNPAIPTDQRGAARVGTVDIGAFELNSSQNGGSYVAQLPAGKKNSPYNYTLVPNNVLNNGAFPYTKTAGTLPNGIQLTTTNNVVSLSGTPTVSGTFNFSITAADGVNSNATTDYTLAISAYTISGQITSCGSPLSGATVTLSGSSSATATTDAAGNYSFPNLPPNGNYTITPSMGNSVFSPTSQTFSNLSANQTQNFTVGMLSITVTNTSDSGAGSLRDAIADICPNNGTITFSNSTAGGAVNFYDGAPHTITLTSGAMTVNKILTIAGAGADFLTVSGNNANTVFNVTGGGNLTLNNLTVSNGVKAIINNAGATLTINNSIVRNNTSSLDAAGIYNNGGTMTINNSTVRNNQAGRAGGGIYNDQGGLTINNSTLSGNSAIGSAIYVNRGSVTVTNSTISNNTGSGIYIGFGSATLINATVAYNSDSSSGGGVAVAAGTLSARNSIFSNNTAPLGPDIYGTISLGDHNLIGNARLAPLGNYGGTTTTHAFLSGSPALNAGDNCVLNQTCAGFNAPSSFTADQRGAGFARLAGSNVDIGAFEVQLAISGQITSGGSPLAGATVTLSGSSNETVTTDAAGNYSLVTVTAGGNYTVTPSKLNYTFAPASQTFSNLSAFQTQNFTATLNNYTISGQVTSGGSPLAGASVALSGSSSGTTTTDASGNYSFPNLAGNGSYTVTPTKTNYAFSPVSQTFNVLSANQTQNFTATLNNYTISGRATAGGSSLAGATVSLSGSLSATTTTDSSGNYSFSNLPAFGNYTITPSKTNYTFSPPSQTFSNLSANQTQNFAATLNNYTISGQITLGGQGLEGATVSLSGSSSGTTTTDSSGNYSFPNLPGNGNYTITPSKTSYIFSPASQTFNVLSANQTQNFAATLNIYTINGQITSGGSPLSGATVSLSGSSSGTTTTDASGNYSFPNLVGNGNYTVTPSKTSYIFSPASQTFNNLSANQTQNFAATLAYTISGQVISDGTALSGVTATLSGSSSATATTDASGNYSFSNLPAGGNYTVTPSRTNYFFTPPNRTFSNLSADQTANFTASCEFMVTNANDGGAGSLRDAIANVCSGGTITFSNSTAGGAVNFYDGAPHIITLASELAIGKNLNITGAGANLLKISGNSASRVFSVGGGKNVTLNNLTIANGKGNGGGILVNASATVTIANSAISSNAAINTDAGGILNYQGTLTIVNSTVSSNTANGNPGAGGGIYNYQGTLTITNSSVSGNSARDGGGIYNYGGLLTINGSSVNNNSGGVGGILNNANGTANITDSTVSGNTTNLDSGGILNFNSTMTITNSTVSGNSAPRSAGGIYNQSTLTLTNATVANNSASVGGGGIYNTATVNARNTIIAGNTAPTAPDFFATLTSGGYNLIGNTGSMSIIGSTTGNITNQLARLAPLGNNGGATMTHALLSGSPALNGGNNCVLTANGCGDGNPAITTDQRGAGFARLAGSAVEIGAFEVQLVITGQITSGGSPLSGVTVSLSGTSSETVTTDSSGNYSLVNVTAGGNYTVTPTKTNYTFSPVSQTFNNVSANQTQNFAATLNNYTISGQITLGGSPLSGATVTLSGSSSATTTTDASGNYSFPNLPGNGSYTVTPSKTNYIFNPASQTFSNLSANQTQNFAATRAYAISGQATSGGNSLAGVTMSLSGSSSATTTTDSSGNYSFPNLAENGNYTVTPSKANYTFSPTSQTFSNLSANQTQNFAATLNNYTIGGQTTSGGSALSGVTMTLSGSSSGTTTTDSSGNYSFPNLPGNGNYTVTPSKTNFAFAPASRTFSNLSQNQTADFTATGCDGNPIVKNTNDNGAGSLRDAIANVCSNSTIVFSNSTAGGATNFFNGSQHTITLTSGALVIAKNMIITGAGADNLTISGNNQSTVFNVSGNMNLTLNNVTVARGTVGILINVGGAATIKNSTVRDNSSSLDSAGILNYFGTLTILNSTVSNNNAVRNAGGIYNYQGTMTLTNSTVSGNSVGGGGGGILNFATTVTITNSTIANNSAAYGGGIFNDSGTVKARNTLVAANTGAQLAPDFYGALTSLGNNLIGITDNNIVITGTMTGNQTGTAAQPLDPRLAPLGFYGGATQTRALLSNSPAINAGSDCVLTANACGDNNPAVASDQRGAARVGTTDIGAFELNNSNNGGSYVAQLPAGRANNNYNYVIAADGGAFNYTISGGSLPPGITLASNFTAVAPSSVVALSGIPTQGGTFNFAVTTSDGTNSVTTNYSLQILAPPTAANVTIGGRVVNGQNLPVRNAYLTLTTQSGETISGRTNPFGYYRFNEIAVGQTVIISVSAKRYEFAPQVLTVMENFDGLNFTALP